MSEYEDHKNAATWFGHVSISKEEDDALKAKYPIPVDHHHDDHAAHH
jgi:hypothetical protein